MSQNVYLIPLVDKNQLYIPASFVQCGAFRDQVPPDKTAVEDIKNNYMQLS